jgi:ribulose-5-phosphate 4-epimerase/fuculose-1-phosphate aldolase
MDEVFSLKRDLVTANHILAHEGVVDGYGHVSARHPNHLDRFFLSCSRSPALVSIDDIMEFDLNCNPIDQSGRAIYAERPIHGAIYKARQEINSVVHNHAHEVIPYTVTEVKLRPVVHVAGRIGREIPVWDIADRFGETDLLVRTMEQGADLARCLGPNNAVLMRGHGATVTGGSLKEAVLVSVYLMVNAKLQAEAMRFGEVKYLSSEEVKKSGDTSISPISLDRVWEFWTTRCKNASRLA